MREDYLKVLRNRLLKLNLHNTQNINKKKSENILVILYDNATVLDEEMKLKAQREIGKEQETETNIEKIYKEKTTIKLPLIVSDKNEKYKDFIPINNASDIQEVFETYIEPNRFIFEEFVYNSHNFTHFLDKYEEAAAAAADSEAEAGEGEHAAAEAAGEEGPPVGEPAADAAEPVVEPAADAAEPVVEPVEGGRKRKSRKRRHKPKRKSRKRRRKPKRKSRKSRRKSRKSRRKPKRKSRKRRRKPKRKSRKRRRR